MLALLISGVVKNYSPIPYSDTWMGGLGFYLDHLDGDTSVWWRFHNEHPNHLARLLFWIDYRWFEGRAILLQAFNVMALICIAIFFGRCAARTLRNSPHDSMIWPTALILGAWLLQWSQKENIVWAFQGVFFLAQFLPCLAAYWLAISVGERHKASGTATAIVLGLLSWGTMANAIFAFPLMAVVAWRTGASRRLLGVLVLLSAAGAVLYWMGLSPQGDDLDRKWAGTVSWEDRAIYLVSLLGGPGRALQLPPWLAQACGSVVLGLVAWHGLCLLKRRTDSGVTVALRGMAGYLALTAVMATMGRAQLGYEQAFSSRYQTPMLMLWASLFLLHLKGLLDWTSASAWRRRSAMACLLLLFAALLARQWQALRPQDQSHLGKELAMLQLELGIKDESSFSELGYPSWEGLASITKRAMAHQVGPFSRQESIARRDLIGKPLGTPTQRSCQEGTITKAISLPGANGDWRLEGWIKTSQPAPALDIWQVVQADRVVGVVLSGLHHPDIGAKHGRAYAYNGFVGYARGLSPASDLVIWNPTEQCRLTVAMPGNATLH